MFAKMDIVQLSVGASIAHKVRGGGTIPTMGAESGLMEQEYQQLEIPTHTLHYLFQLVQASALFYLSLKAVDLSCVSVMLFVSGFWSYPAAPFC